MTKAAHKFDFSKVLVWNTDEALGQFHYLVENPPLHSVVIHMEPSVAGQLLQTTNDRNRPMAMAHANRLLRDAHEESYELTGDTLKFSKKGRMLDGQHRLHACANQKKPIITHAVFGLDDAIFDVIDQGKKRTPGDVLALCGVSDYLLVAGAVRQAVLIGHGRRGWDMGGGGKVTNIPSLTPRGIRKLVLGPMKDIVKHAKNARLLSTAYKHPPTMLAAILYLIGKHSEAVAESFTQDWLNGNRNYQRNKNFDVLAQRINVVKQQANGHVHRAVRCAMIIQCFNHWNANIAASSRSITWKKEWTFPAFEFDKNAFIKNREQQHYSDTSLKAMQFRVLNAMVESADQNAEVSMPIRDLAKKANVHHRAIVETLRTLVVAKSLTVVDKATNAHPARYRISAFDGAKANGRQHA